MTILEELKAALAETSRSAGCGKSYARLHDLAERLVAELDAADLGVVTLSVLRYQDANGVMHDKQFYDATKWGKRGRLIFIEEKGDE